MTVRSTISGYGNHIVYVDDVIIGHCRRDGLWSGLVQYRDCHVSITGIKGKARIIDMMAAVYMLINKGKVLEAAAKPYRDSTWEEAMGNLYDKGMLKLPD